MRDLVTGDCEGYLTLFLETGAGLHRVGHIYRDSSGTQVEIRLNENSYPFIHDWDEDGRKDLVLGESHYNIPDTGNVRIYLNNGTNSQPAFKTHFWLLAGGQLLFQPRANPGIYDLDRDSVKDLVLGNDNGFVYFYKNVGTNTFPVCNAEYETLHTRSGVFIDALTESRFRFLDWNGDGDLDLLLGGQDGYVWLYENADDVGVTENDVRSAIPALTISPNPFRTTTDICIGHRAKSIVNGKEHGTKSIELQIYDAVGRLVRSFTLGSMPYALCWNGTDHSGHSVPSGVYFVRIDIDGRIYTKPIIKLK
jgi:hypothetical protein